MNSRGHIQGEGGRSGERVAAARRHEGGDLVVVHVLEVPRQTPLRAFATLDNDAAIDQKLALELSRLRELDLGVEIRARGIVAHRRETVLEDVIREEEADAVFVEWRDPSREENRRHIPVIRSILDRAPCEVTVIKIGREGVHDIVALVSDGRTPGWPQSGRSRSPSRRGLPV